MTTNGQVYTISGISGEFLKDHDLIGKQDPYVIFEHGHQKVETSVSKLITRISPCDFCCLQRDPSGNRTRTLSTTLSCCSQKRWLERHLD